MLRSAVSFHLILALAALTTSGCINVPGTAAIKAQAKLQKLISSSKETKTTAPPAVIVAPGSPIRPGQGFNGATAQPDAIGSPGQFGYDDRAIAKWDVVPYQVFSDRFNVGVLAFHHEGIERVDFSVNGGPWTSVAQPAVNGQVANTSGIGLASEGVLEYYATLYASDFPTDGPVEVRAIAYPKIGIPSVLPSLTLNSNKNGTLNPTIVYVSPAGDDNTGDGSLLKPMKTLQAAALRGVQISGSAGENVLLYLQAGDYAMPGLWNNIWTGTSWLTVSAAPGVPRSQVRITSYTASGFSTNLLHLTNLTIGDGVNGVVIWQGGGYSDHPQIWVDSVDWIGPGNSVNLGGLTVVGAQAYWTNTSLRDSSSHISGAIVRNCTVTRGVIAYQGVDLMVNSTAESLEVPAGTDFHSDVLQYFNPTPGWGNIIIYGLRTIGPINAQGITFGPGGFSDIAVIDVAVTGAMNAFSAQGYAKNLYVKNSSFEGSSSGWIDQNGIPLPSGGGPGFTATNVVLENFQAAPLCNLMTPIPGVTIR